MPCRCNSCKTFRICATDPCQRCDVASSSHLDVQTNARSLQAGVSTSTLPRLSAANLLSQIECPASSSHAEQPSTSADVMPGNAGADTGEPLLGMLGSRAQEPVMDAATQDSAVLLSPPLPRAPKRRRIDAPRVLGVQTSPARRLLRCMELPGMFACLHTMNGAAVSCYCFCTLTPR